MYKKFVFEYWIEYYNVIFKMKCQKWKLKREMEKEKQVEYFIWNVHINYEVLKKLIYKNFKANWISNHKTNNLIRYQQLDFQFCVSLKKNNLMFKCFDSWLRYNILKLLEKRKEKTKLRLKQYPVFSLNNSSKYSLSFPSVSSTFFLVLHVIIFNSLINNNLT